MAALLAVDDDDEDLRRRFGILTSRASRCFDPEMRHMRSVWSSEPLKSTSRSLGENATASTRAVWPRKIRPQQSGHALTLVRRTERRGDIVHLHSAVSRRARQRQRPPLTPAERRHGALVRTHRRKQVQSRLTTGRVDAVNAHTASFAPDSQQIRQLPSTATRRANCFRCFVCFACIAAIFILVVVVVVVVVVIIIIVIVVVVVVDIVVVVIVVVVVFERNDVVVKPA